MTLTKAQLAKIHSRVHNKRTKVRSSIHIQMKDMKNSGMSNTEIKKAVIRDTRKHINEYQ